MTANNRHQAKVEGWRIVRGMKVQAYFDVGTRRILHWNVIEHPTSTNHLNG